MSNLPVFLIAKYAERIDKYLGNNSEFSRSDIQKLIELKAVLVNDILVRKPKFKVKPDDKITINEIINREIKAQPQNIDLEIVYEDEYLIVVNKPSGMVVHPAPGHYDQTLVNALLYHFQNLSNINGQIRPGIVHRIDKDTSGLILIAKNNEVHIKLAEAIKNHQVKRSYLAWVKGQMENDVTHINLPIGRDPKNRKKMAVTRQNSKEAITHVYTKKVFEDKSLVYCELETGRTHQIRVHLAYIKHPIINDPVYGTSKDSFGQYLHAFKLEFKHPILNKIMKFETAFPQEFKQEKISHF